MKLKFRNRPEKIENQDFYSRVYDLVRLIPPGRVTSYGAIAKFIGSPLSSRMVGWAMNAAHGDIPAHRVVNRSGILTGKHHFGEPQQMQKLLEAEGIKIQNDRVIDFKKVFWDPYKELF